MFHRESDDTCFALAQAAWRSEPYDRVAESYRASLEQAGRRGGPDRRVGDISGKQQDSSASSWIQNLRSKGVVVSPLLLPQPDVLREKIRVALREGRLYFAPRCDVHPGMERSIPSLTECVAQYRRDDATEKPIKDIYSHGADALQFALHCAWGQTKMRVEAR